MTPRAVARAGTFAGALGALLWVHACREETSPKTGSETNFLQSCEATCDDGLSCVCGVCTQPCSGTGECTGLAPGAECVEVGDRAPEAACPDADCTAFCDLTCRSDHDCEALGTSFRCRDGYCRTLSWDGGL